jgi:hypothetical protein
MKALLIFVLAMLFCGTLAASVNVSGTISTNTTFGRYSPASDGVYIVTADITVQGAASPVLTIEAGVVVKFNAARQMIIGHASSPGASGNLAINGTATDPVLFTANTATPTPGFWVAVKGNTYSTVTVNYCTFEYGGSTNGLYDVLGGSPQFDHCTFRYSQNYGIYHTSNTSSASVQNSAFNNNGTYPLFWNANQAYLIGTGNTYSGNTTNRIMLRAVTVATSQTWLNQGIPYQAEGNITIEGALTPILQIQSGTQILFLSGRLMFIGNSGSPAVAGGLNADGVTFAAITPATGWNGLYFMTYTAGSTLSNCTIRDVNSSPTGSIYIMSTINAVTIQNCQFLSNNNYGVYATDNGNFSISGTTFQQCAKTVSVAARDVYKLGSGNQYLSNTDNRIFCRGGIVSSSCSWTNQGTPIYISANLSCYDASLPVLTIPFGTVLEFASGNSFTVGYSGSPSINGTLNATGVTFRGAVNTAGYWPGLTFQRYGGASVLSGCTITDAGYNSTAAVTYNQPDGTMTGCLIQNCSAVGVRFVSNIVLVSLSGNTITQCGSYPLSVPANCVRVLGIGNNFSGNTLNMVEVRAETVDTSGTWGNPGVPYFLNSSMAIYGSTFPHIKIEAGAVVMLANAAYLTIGYSGSPALKGSLEAKGVTFTRKTAGENPNGLIFYQYVVNEACVFTNCVFEYMKHNSYLSAVYVSGAAPTFMGCTFTNNPDIAIKGTTDARFTVSNCRFINNGGYPISTSAAAFDVVSGTGNFFSGNNPNRILIGGGLLEQNYTWDNPSVPVEVTADILVYASTSPVLTINSGVTLLFRTNTGIYVGYSGSPAINGGIHADGATFSALSGVMGGWRGIGIQPYLAGGSYIRNCIIEYGGTNGNINVTSVNFPSIESCVIRYGNIGIRFYGPNSTSNVIRNHITYNTVGVYCDNSGHPLIGGALGDANAIYGNTTYGVQNITTTVTVNAEYNWWGDASGPYHAVTNPAGLGDDVSNYVDYTPWRTTNIGDAPARFHLLTPANAAVLDTVTPVMDWGDAIDPTPGDVVTYTLELARDTGFTVGFISIPGLLTSVYHMPEGVLFDNLRYYWRVKATDTQTQTTWSYESYFYFDTAVPEYPLPFDLISPTYNQVLHLTSNLLTWEATTDPDIGDMVSYTVYVDDTAGFETPELLNTSGTSIYSGFCAPGTLYYWKVKATDLTDRSTFSPTWRFFVHPDAIPRAPVYLTLSPSGSNMFINWDSVPGADSYSVYYSSGITSGFTLLQMVPVAQYLHPGGALAGHGFYYVIANDSF